MIDITQTGLAFIEGLALSVSPCILPILPIILSASAIGGRGRPYGIILGFILVFSLVTVFSRQWVLSWGIDPELLRQISFIILLLFGLVLISSRLSERFVTLTQGVSNLGNQLTQHTSSQNGFLSGILLGGCVGLVWVPCVGPILASVIVQSIQQNTSWDSFVIVLVFSMGAALPMLLFALGGNKFMQNLTFFKQHSSGVRKVLGWLIIATVLFSAQESLFPIPGFTKTSVVPQTQNRLVSGLAKSYKAPEIKDIDTWINSPPLTIAQLKGKVVLIDFWTYSCINCIRTLPYLTSWDQKYRNQGLVIIGIHSPEFEFEKKEANVERAVQRQGIHYPVALDNRYGTWKSFHNNYWPAHFLIDKEGNVVYTHFGEGEYDVTENNIQYLLGLKATPTTQPASKNSAFSNALQTPETYLGYARAERFGSPQPIRPSQLSQYSFPGFLPLHSWALNGSWTIADEKIISGPKKAALQLNFAARNVYLVLGSRTGRAIVAHILLNGKPIKKFQGKDIHEGVVTVHQHTLYELIHLDKSQNALLEIQVNTPGLEAYAFTFGN